MLDAAKALLLGGGNYPAILDQRCRAVVIIRGNTKHAHHQAFRGLPIMMNKPPSTPPRRSISS